MALCRFADRRGDRPGRDRGTTRCGRSQRGHAASAHSAADRARLAGREPAQRRNRVVDLPRRPPRCRRRCRGIIQPRRRRPDPVARGCWKPGRRLRAGAAVHGRNPICTGCGRQHRPPIHQHLRGVASVGAFDTVADHYGYGLRHDAGASGLRTVGSPSADYLLCGVGDRGLRCQCAGFCADGIASPSYHRTFVAGAALGLTVLALVIVVRIVYLAVYRATVAAIKCWHPSLADRLVSRDPRGTIVISWSGMRGLVTLATAFALPPQFPGRDLIMLCAFCVVLGTLVIQGLTLRPLLRLLRLQDDGAVEREISRARIAVMEAAVDSLDADRSRAATLIR